MEMLSTEARLPAHLNSGSCHPAIPSGQPKPPFGVYVACDLPSVEALTDGGRSIPAFVYQASYIVARGQQFDAQDPAQFRWAYCASEDQFLRNSKQDVGKLRRVVDPFLESNCHGWVFAGGRFAIKDDYVGGILADHGYSPVTEPVVGDLAVYLVDGVATHTGLVRASQRGAIVIESKWGPFGVFHHPPEAYSFVGDCTFYRTARPHHMLQLRAVAN